MLSSFIRNYLVIAAVLFVTDWCLPNVSLGYPTGSAFSWEAFGSNLPVLLTAALVLTLLSLIARPILKFLSWPINFVTLGLFNVVINVLLFWLATYLVTGFQISALAIGDLQLNLFFSYATVALVFGLIEALLGLIF